MGGRLKNSAWRFAHASAIGAAHVQQNTECQDRFACRTFETDAGETYLVAAVADGAGSTTNGGRGAEIACELFVEQKSAFLNTRNASLESLNDDFGRRWIAYFQLKIREIADAEKKPLREFASTLVGAVVGKGGAVFLQVGDGAIVFSSDGVPQSYRFGIEPNESEYVNMTDFLTDETAAERLRVRFVNETVEDLILFSDGVFPVAVDYQTNRPHEPFLLPMIAPLRSENALDGLNEKLEKFLSSPKINEKTDDDKTLVLASRAGRVKN